MRKPSPRPSPWALRATIVVALALGGAVAGAAFADASTDASTDASIDASGTYTGVLEIDPDAGRTLTLDDGRVVRLHLGPARFLARRGVELEAGDRIDVTGHMEPSEGLDHLWADSIATADGVVRLRDEDGDPAWSARAGGERPGRERDRAARGGHGHRGHGKCGKQRARGRSACGCEGV